MIIYPQNCNFSFKQWWIQCFSFSQGGGGLSSCFCHILGLNFSINYTQAPGHFLPPVVNMFNYLMLHWLFSFLRPIFYIPNNHITHNYQYKNWGTHFAIHIHWFIYKLCTGLYYLKRLCIYTDQYSTSRKNEIVNMKVRSNIFHSLPHGSFCISYF